MHSQKNQYCPTEKRTHITRFFFFLIGSSVVRNINTNYKTRAPKKGSIHSYRSHVCERKSLSHKLILYSDSGQITEYSETTRRLVRQSFMLAYTSRRYNMLPDIVRFETAFGESSRQPALDQSARHIRFMPIYGKSCELAWWEGSLEESISNPGMSGTVNHLLNLLLLLQKFIFCLYNSSG